MRYVCSCCGRSFPSVVIEDIQSDYVCLDCINKFYELTVDGEYVPKDQAIFLENGDCYYLYDSRIFNCSHCGKYDLEENLILHNKKYFCKDCFEEVKATIKVIINEQHSLLPEQEDILNKNFNNWEFEKIPAKGLTLDEIENLSTRDVTYIFVSPIPALMALLAKKGKEFRVFHNDKREKKELPNGKIIMTVAETGWVLV